MHNLHLVVVKSTDAETACSLVEDYIQDWGDENNWRTICGCVSEDNEVHDIDRNNFMGGRYCPSDCELTTIDIINAHVKEHWLTITPDVLKIVEEIDGGVKKVSTLDDYETILLKGYLDSRYFPALKETFNVLESEMNAGCYDECGVTNIESDDEDDKDDEETIKTYVVFVDMHS